MRKKIISIALGLCMILSTITVFAENDKALADASDVKEYLADIVVNAEQGTNGHLGSIGGGAYIRIPRVDFKNKKYTSLEIKYGVDDVYAGATLYVYIDSMDKAPIAEYILKSTGSFLTIEPMETSIDIDITGLHDIYVSFSRAAACDFVGMSFKTADGNIPDEVYELSNKDSIIKLYKLGIINYESPFRPDKSVTNSEVLAAVRKISSQFIISDSDFETQYSYAPTDNATRDSILKIFSLAAGYGNITGFGDLNVFDHVIMKNNSITRKEFANCLDNFLNVKVAETTFGINTTISKSDESVMNKCMGIYESKGVVQSNSITSLDGKYYKDSVLIGDNVYGKNGLDTDEYFGYNVKAYYKESNSGDYDLTAIIPYRNNEIELTSDDEIHQNGLKLTYDDGKRTRTATLDGDFSLIYNGIYTPVFDNNVFNTFYGTLKLIDNNNDSKYDFVVMSDTYDKVVMSVTSDEVICGKNGWSLNLKDSDYTIKNASGKIISESEIKGIEKGYVISVGKAVDQGKDTYTVIVSSKTVSGVIESKEYDGDDMIIIIDGAKYRLSKFADDDISCTAGDEVTLVLSAANRVVEIEKKSIERKFGYIDKVTIDDNEDIIFVRIYNEDQEYIRTVCADKITVDGKRYKKYNAIKNIMLLEKNKERNEKDIITYMLDSEGKLSLIDYPYTYTGYTPASDISKRKNENENENSIFLNFKGGGTFKKDIMSIGGVNVADDNAKVFLIPSDAEDYSDYAVESADSYFTQDGVYSDVKGYGTNIKDIHSKAYLIFDSASKQPHEMTTVSYIKSISKDSAYYNDEIYSQIEYLQNGGEYTALVKPNDSVEKIISKLNAGDMIQMTVNSEGIVENLEPMYLTSQGKIYDNDTAISWGRTNSYVTGEFNTARYVVKDRISKIIGSNAILENTGIIVEIENPKYFGTNFCIYDQAATRNKVTAAGSNDVTEGSEVVMMIYYGSVNGLIILR